MATDTYSLDQISPETKNWSVSVVVVLKTPMRGGIGSPFRCQKLILLDKKGSSAEAVLYGGNIEYYRKSFVVDKAYVISNAILKSFYGQRNPLVTSPYQWVIEARSVVHLDDCTEISPAAFSPPFITFGQCIQLVGTKSLTNVLCVVVQSKSPKRLTINGKRCTIHEYAVVDTELKSTVLTLWNDIVSDEMYNALASGQRIVIAALNFSTSSYYGLSLGSTMCSFITDKLQTKAFANMEAWLSVYKESIDMLVALGETTIHAEDHSNQSISITQLVECEKTAGDRFLIMGRGTLSTSTSDQNFMYMCSDNCTHSTLEEHNTPFKCKQCGSDGVVVPRYKFVLTLADESGVVNITIFGEHGDNIIGMPASKFYEKYSDVATFPVDEANERLRLLLLHIKVRPRFFTTRAGNQLTSYSAVSISFENLCTGISPSILGAAVVSPPEHGSWTYRRICKSKNNLKHIYLLKVYLLSSRNTKLELMILCMIECGEYLLVEVLSTPDLK